MSTQEQGRGLGSGYDCWEQQERSSPQVKFTSPNFDLKIKDQVWAAWQPFDKASRAVLNHPKYAAA